MPTIADYVVIKDPLFDPGESFRFDLPDLQYDRRSLAVVSFMVLTEEVEEPLTFRVLVNGADAFGKSGPITESNFFSAHEALESQVIPLHEHDNTIEFRKVGGSGKLRFSDVVLWYKVKVK